MVVACIVFVYTFTKLIIFSIIFKKNREVNTFSDEIKQRRLSMMVGINKKDQGLYSDYFTSANFRKKDD
jgi:hypothetical protein